MSNIVHPNAVQVVEGAFVMSEKGIYLPRGRRGQFFGNVVFYPSAAISVAGQDQIASAMDSKSYIHTVLI